LIIQKEDVVFMTADCQQRRTLHSKPLSGLAFIVFKTFQSKQQNFTWHCLELFLGQFLAAPL
jgi:hypothetical protein